MLEKLKEKYPYKSLRLLCGSYFDLNFGDGYDVVLSTYSLHHFNEEEKLFLYRKIYASTNENGVFIEGDYIVNSLEKQFFHLSELNRLKREQGICDGESFHYDIPLTVETQVGLLNKAGFRDVKIAKQWDNTGIFVARR
jgi:SAM-dependent methyltransferase